MIEQAGRHVDLNAIKTGQSRLLKILFLRFGKTTKISKAFGVTSHNISNWWRVGAIPLNSVGKISRRMKCSPYALNYPGMMNLLGSGASWDNVISGCELTAEERRYIKKGTSPQVKIS